MRDLCSGEWEDLYDLMGFVGQPYYITNFDNHYYISEISADKGNGIRFFDIIDNEISEVGTLYYYENVTEESRKIYNEKEASKKIPSGEWADLIIFAGQSNMAGIGEADIAPMAENGYEFHAVSDPSHLYPAIEPFGINENRQDGIDHAWDGIPRKTGGLVTSFMNAYTMITNVPVIGVSASEGNTMISQWVPGTPRFADLADRMNAATIYLDNNSAYTIRNTYVVWCQGESDGDAGTSKEEYLTQFDKLVNSLLELGADYIFVIGIGERQGDVPNDYGIIREAQKEYCDTHDHCTMIVSFYGMTEFMKDAYHYTQEGYNQIGTEAGTAAGMIQ